jgi:hypothetical protein
MASPNRFTPLGDDEISHQREDADAAAPPLGEDADAAATPLGSTDPRAPTLGWDAFVGSLEETAQRELGVVDDILISYANFAGEAFRGFDIESARVMDRIIAMEDALEFDHDEVVQTSGSLSDLKEIVLANATGLSNINTMMKENATTVAALRDIVDATSTQVKTMAAALRDVTETANTAFRLASGAQPTIDGHGVRLNALVVDVSKMSSDIDGLRALIQNLLNFVNFWNGRQIPMCLGILGRCRLQMHLFLGILWAWITHSASHLLDWMTYTLCFLMLTRLIGLLVSHR